MLNYARLCYNYANYALCSDCVIMPKSNAGIIGLPQVLGHKGAMPQYKWRDALVLNLTLNLR